MPADQLARHLAALTRIQGQPPHVDTLSPTRHRLGGRDGDRVLETRTEGGDWVVIDEPLAGGTPRQVIVIGAGLGRGVEAALRASTTTRVLVLEPDPGVAGVLLSGADWSAAIDAGRLQVLSGPDYRGAINCARLLDVRTPPVVLASAALLTHQLDAMTSARAVAVKLVTDATANLTARRRFAGRYLLQTLGNLPRLVAEGDAAALDGRLAGRPAVVVGAGPSLDDNLPALATLQDRAVVIAADTALRPLLAAGVRPHVVVGVDPAELNAEHLAGVPDLDGVYLVAEGSLHPAAFGSFTARTFVFKVSDHEPWPWLRTLGVDRGGLRAWGSVVTSAFDLALRMGCEPIVFAGLDLSYPVRRPYCANTIYDRKWHEAMAQYGCTWEQLVDDFFARLDGVTVPDVHGAPVLSSAPLVSFRDWLQQQIAAGTGRRVVNATGAGILHGPGLELASLTDVLGERPPIGTEVRAALAAAHTSAGAAAAEARLAAACRAVAAQPETPTHAALLDRWVEFSAGTLERDHLLAALDGAFPVPG